AQRPTSKVEFSSFANQSSSRGRGTSPCRKVQLANQCRDRRRPAFAKASAWPSPPAARGGTGFKRKPNSTLPVRSCLVVIGVVHRFLSGCHSGKELLLRRPIGCAHSHCLVHSINRILDTRVGRGIEGRARSESVD